jgi:putative peptidoglycan lipid II flippase
VSLLRNVGTIGGLTMVSRVFGFMRDILLARVLGAGGVADAWQLAFQLPNIFRRLFAEGAFASAFVPLFNQRMKHEGDMVEARHFADDVLAVLVPVLIVFSGLAMLAMPWIAGLFANDAMKADPRLYDLAVLMARVAFPYLFFMSVATVFAGILNSLSRFAAAAAAPILLNICMVAALVWGALQPDSPVTRENVGLLLGIAVSISGLLQMAWLGWWAHRMGFAFRLRRPRLTKGVRELGLLIGPAVLGAGVYQISRFIDLFFLSTLPEGSYTFLAMGDRLNQLPLGIIGVALGTAILPSLSRHIAQDDHGSASRLQSNAVELALLLTVPAAVALFISGSAFTRAFYTGGAFTLENAIATGTVVSALVVGLPAYVLVKVLVPNFFARKDTRTPVYTAAGSLLINIALNFALVPQMGVAGLALAGSLGAWCNVLALYALLSLRGHFRLTGVAASRIGRIIVAAAFMGVILWYAMPYGTQFYAGAALERIGAVLALVALGGVAFLIAAVLLGVLSRDTLNQLRRRPA